MSRSGAATVSWPDPRKWDQHGSGVVGRLAGPTFPISTCFENSTGSPCTEEAEFPQDVAAAVDFARSHCSRPAGQGHLGRGHAPDSLLVWTHRRRSVGFPEAFSGRGTGGPALPAPCRGRCATAGGLHGSGRFRPLGSGRLPGKGRCSWRMYPRTATRSRVQREGPGSRCPRRASLATARTGAANVVERCGSAITQRRSSGADGSIRAGGQAFSYRPTAAAAD